METLQAIKSRRSIRKFKSDMIPKDILDKIIEAGTYAPTGRNAQSPIIIAVTNKEVRDKLSKMNSLIMGKEKPTYIYDGTLVMENLMLAAHDLGIGSCWIHRAKEEFESEEGKELLKSLGISGDYEGIGHCVLGYADCDEPTPTKRKDDYIYYID